MKLIQMKIHRPDLYLMELGKLAGFDSCCPEGLFENTKKTKADEGGAKTYA